MLDPSVRVAFVAFQYALAIACHFASDLEIDSELAEDHLRKLGAVEVEAVECPKLLMQCLAEELKTGLESGLSLVDNSIQAGLH